MAPLGFRSLSKTAQDDLEETIAHGVNRAVKAAYRGATGRTDARAENLKFALHAIEAALFALDDIRALIEEACEMALAAADVNDEAERALFADRYDEIRLSIDPIANDAEFEGVNLLGDKAKPLDVDLDGRANYSVTAAQMTSSNKGLNLPPPEQAFAEADEIQKIIEHLDRALTRVDRASEIYCRDAEVLSLRISAHPS